jgi:hypothetical protein
MSRLQPSPSRETIFARKGEAVPAGVAGVAGSGAERMPITVRTGLSPLSSLIQRRVPPPARGNATAAAVSTVERLAVSAWTSETRAEVDDYAVVVASDVSRAPRPNADGVPPAEWRRLSLRLPPEDYRRLKNLANLWGVSGQGLLQKAVETFLEAAVSAPPPMVTN